MDQLIIKWEKIPQIYPLFLLIIATVIVYFVSTNYFFVVMLILTVLQFFYFCWQYSYRYAKKMEKLEEPDGDVAGNTNITKKFIDHM